MNLNLAEVKTHKANMLYFSHFHRVSTQTVQENVAQHICLL